MKAKTGKKIGVNKAKEVVKVRVGKHTCSTCSGGHK